jgi:uncharacterized repeat protein (TIGR01451 family)
MKKFLLILYGVVLSCIVQAQVLRPFTVRYNNPSVKGNIIQVANNIFTSVGGVDRTTNPGNTTEAPPGGVSRNNSTVGKNINLDAMVPFGSSWKYLAAAGATPVGWTGILFADGAWPAANGELGYGDADETTCIPSGGGGTVCVPTGTKVITTYFRKTINIVNPLAYTNFRFKVERDDGYVLYVNGIEMSRNNMPAGAVAHGTLASADVNDAVITFTVPNTTFIAGNNVIAVEVHQRSAGGTGSDDLSFNLELTALTGTSSDIFNSSTADLSLPGCSQILFAGLYWGATQGTDGINTSWITGETAVKFKVAGSLVYQNLTSTQTDYHNDALVPGLPHTGYRCFRDVTSLLNATSPNGTYGVANMATPEGIVNGAGGWAIVIVYADPATIVRNLTVFDGSAIMNGGDPPLNVPITGFLTPPSGPVSCELGAVVYDGDRTSTDAYMFKQDSNPLVGSYTNLTPNTTSNLNDMWNSTITRYGANVTTRNPAHNNTLGYDADILIVPNALNAVLGNNATSASVQVASPSENYFIHTISTAISQYTPSFAVSKNATDLNGGSLVPGDSLRYQIDYQNNGNDASTATTIIDNIPAGTSYAPNSLFINGVAKTDAVGDDQAEYDFTNNRVIFRLGTGANGTTGGEINPTVSGNVTFKVYTPASCALFACNSTISNRARMAYAGKLSLLNLYDSSGVISGGCNTPNPQVNTISGSCLPLGDTVLANICPATTVQLPIARYGGYSFHTGIPFTVGNRYNPATPVTFNRVIYAFYDGPGSCDDTIRIAVFITACPDIDDDNDGIPDYVEMNDALAWGNHDGDGNLNWNDAQYPGYIDNNTDGFNDNFDPSADSDNDGNPNFYDSNFPGWLDSNSDGINDNMDKDLDGIPNHLDLDSDNDGIPDTVESFGVDANGDGIIDNYSDTDNDGFSQNVDFNNTGVTNSALGLGPLDTDGDGIPNYLDLDSDNDGIPDITEAFGTDASNSAKVSAFADVDGDGYADALDADVGNDAVSENSSSSILRTGTDGNSDGRTDSWPNKNMDADSKPSPYDLDSDGDGITDVKEAGFTDADWNGRVDGGLNTEGRNTVLAALPTLTLPNTDGVGRTNPYDIDSDEDGIPDNVEGLTTLGYLLPSYTDTDGDGLDNSYDNFNGFGGDGIHPCDIDGDTVPDYLDSDTDGDGLIDRVEGNDLNFNAMPDDNVTLTGVDTDGDGLDNRFDNDNASTKATSRYMGTGGTTSGEIPPGSITTVQHSTIAAFGCPTERDWRCVFYVLNCDIITFKATLQNGQTKLNWTVLCEQEVDYFIIERSVDGVNFSQADMIAGRPVINAAESYSTTDDVGLVTADIIYYRLKTVSKTGKIKLSNIIVLYLNKKTTTEIQVLPNPVKSRLQLIINSDMNAIAQVYIIDGTGKVVQKYTENVLQGSNTFIYSQTDNLQAGTYYMRVNTGVKVFTKKFSVIK